MSTAMWYCTEHDSNTGFPWWRHQMETFSTLLAICAGNSPFPGEFPTQRPVTRSFDITLTHNDHGGVSNHQSHGCLLNRLFRSRSKKTSKLRVTCLCAGNSPGTGEFPAQKASYAENVSIWWRHHDVYFDLRPNKRLSKQSWGWWFETPSRPLWRHRNVSFQISHE